MDADVRRKVLRLARRQHGIVTRAELLAAGMTSHAIDWGLSSGQLVRLFPGVYRVAGAPDSWAGRALAAQRHVTQQATRARTLHPPIVAVGGAAAAHVHGLPRHDRPPRIVVASSQRARVRKLLVAHRPALSVGDVTTVQSIPVTGLAWTAVARAAELGGTSGQDLLASLVGTGTLSVGQLVGAAHRADGVRGRGAVLAWLHTLGPRVDHHRSGAERRLDHACAGLDIAPSARNLRVRTSDGARHELDLVWEEELLDVEVDGPHHLEPSQRARDRARDRALRADGWEVTRFPVEEVDEDPLDVARRIEKVLEQRRGE